MKRTQMTISFGEYDDDVYNFLQSQKNASALIRRLVRSYMGGSGVPAPLPSQNQIEDNKSKTDNEVAVTVEEHKNDTVKQDDNGFDYSKCTPIKTETNDENRKRIQALDL